MDVGLEVERFLRHLLRMRCMRQSSHEFVPCEMLTFIAGRVRLIVFIHGGPVRENNGVGSTG